MQTQGASKQLERAIGRAVPPTFTIVNLLTYLQPTITFSRFAVKRTSITLCVLP
jgi:hypothetical protein